MKITRDSVIKTVLVAAVLFLTIMYGVKPLFNRGYFLHNNDWASGKLGDEKDIYDVVVVGGEPDGIAAAVSAARVGAKTLLLVEGEDLGGIVTGCMNTAFEYNIGPGGELLNTGIFSEILDRMGKDRSVGSYLKAVGTMVSEEKRLTAVMDAHADSAVTDSGKLAGLVVSGADGSRRTYRGKRFIDATRDGTVLMLCGVPSYTGSADLNMEGAFRPARLDFEMEGVDGKQLVAYLKSKDSANLYNLVGKYKTAHVNIRIHDFNIVDQGGKKAVVEGIEVFGLNLDDGTAVKQAYDDAVSEAKDLAAFLTENLDGLFGYSSFSQAASMFYMPEYRHFKGTYTLTVADILENRNFADKIAVASRPVDGSVFADGAYGYIIGKPAMYSIPLECLVPAGVDNLLMTGAKASYSSLAATSAGAISTAVTEGESAGAACVFSILRNLTTGQFAGQKDSDAKNELERLLKRQGVHLPKTREGNPNRKNWAYPAVRELATLGLIAGGTRNDYTPNKQASAQDLAILLENGIIRLSPEKYSLGFDNRLRRYFTSDKLTPELAGRMLASLYGVNVSGSDPFARMCGLGYISSELRLRLTKPEAKPVLTMDDVYYLAAYNIKKYTGKEII